MTLIDSGLLFAHLSSEIGLAKAFAAFLRHPFFAV